MTFSSTDFGYFVELAAGDELIRCLIQFGREQEVDAAVLTGIGSLSEVELGSGAIRDLRDRRTHLLEPLESCSLTGTLTLVDGEPFPHLHGSFARVDHSVIGGHIYQAVCANALELMVHLVTPVSIATQASTLFALRH